MKSPAVSSPLFPCKDPVAIRNPSLPRPRVKGEDRKPPEGRAGPRVPWVLSGRQCSRRRNVSGLPCEGGRPGTQPVVPPRAREAATSRRARDTLRAVTAVVAASWVPAAAATRAHPSPRGAAGRYLAAA
ncbi:hypothetical protein HJG60_008272 [Phyllostomus discolor]|uniref:Uncharacterized protein n=1 Tax=Phyllostomus discolor TaxID=89673 RepID=A0A834DSL2_9CHIR|nr:hypothetical protein HJG60_008272 [Phyllostomus discolor]